MSKPDVTADLPAPISLTLEEASKVAAGASAFVLPGAIPWWWKGQAAFVNTANPEQVVTTPVLNVGKVAGF